MQAVYLIGKNLMGTFIVAINKGTNLFIDNMRRFIRDILVLGNRMPKEDFTLFFTVGHGTAAL